MAPARQHEPGIVESDSLPPPLRDPADRRHDPLACSIETDDRGGSENFGGTTERPAGNRGVGSGVSAWGNQRVAWAFLSEWAECFRPGRPPVFESNGLLGCMLEGLLVAVKREKV